MNNVNNINKINKIIVIMTFIFSVLVGFVLIFGESVWLDEISTIRAVESGNLIDLMKWVQNDVHPPLYYLGLKLIFFLCGNHIFLYKAFSWLSIVTVHSVLVFQFFKNESLSARLDASILFSIYIIITTIQSNFLFCGTEVRMYGWTMCFVTLSGVWAYKVYCSTKLRNILWFIVFSLASAYCHYFGLLSEVFIYVFLFILLINKEYVNVKKCFLISVTTIIGYLPWVPLLLHQINNRLNNFWVDTSFNQISSFFQSIIGYDFKCELLVISVLVVFSIYELCISKHKEYILWGMFYVSLVSILIITGIIIGEISHPILTEKYLTSSLGLFWLGIIILIYSLPSNIKKFMTSLLVYLIVFCSIYSYPDRLLCEYCTGTRKTIEFINSNVGENDILLSNIAHLSRGSVLSFFFPDYDVYDIESLDLYNIDNTAWFFAGKDSFDLGNLSQAGLKVEFVYSGNIDSNYFFDVYKIYR